MARRHANFKWQLVLSEASGASTSGTGARAGLVHEAVGDALLRKHPDLASCDFYVCGPPLMLAATRALLKSLGVAEERVAFDDFKV